MYMPDSSHSYQFHRALVTLEGPSTNLQRGLVLRNFIVARLLGIYRVVNTGFDAAGLGESELAANGRERRR